MAGEESRAFPGPWSDFVRPQGLAHNVLLVRPITIWNGSIEWKRARTFDGPDSRGLRSGAFPQNAPHLFVASGARSPSDGAATLLGFPRIADPSRVGLRNACGDAAPTSGTKARTGNFEEIARLAAVLGVAAGFRDFLSELSNEPSLEIADLLEVGEGLRVPKGDGFERGVGAQHTGIDG